MHKHVFGDYVKSWLSMFATKLDELLTNQDSPRGMHIAPD